MTYAYCKSKGIPVKKCGKVSLTVRDKLVWSENDWNSKSFVTFAFQLIVAVYEEEVPRLMNLYERGEENGAKDLKLLDKHEIKEIEPNCEV